MLRMRSIMLAFTAIAITAVVFLLPFKSVSAADAPAKFTQCKACHSTVAGQNRVGPSLFGVVGRKAGTGENFPYSPAMKNYGQTWNAAQLQAWLTDPKSLVPGTKMTFPGIQNSSDVQAIVAYLQTLK